MPLWRELCQSQHDVSLVQVVACGGSCVSQHNVSLVSALDLPKLALCVMIVCMYASVYILVC